MYDIEFTKQALKDLQRVPKNYAVLILKKIKQLSIKPYDKALDVKKLQGIDNAYRLRIGDYRVIYEIENKKLLINVVKIQSRGSVYG